MMNRRIRKLSQNQNVFIFTNLDLTYTRSNIYTFEDMLPTWKFDKKWKEIMEYWVYDVFKFIWSMDDYQRSQNVPRNKRIKYFVFLDEWWILFNSHNWSKFPQWLIQYLLQIRKINTRLFVWAQKYRNVVSQLREHVDKVFYFKRFLWIFKDFWTIRMKEVDLEWNTIMDVFLAKDEQGDYIKKEKPRDEHVEFFYKPSRYKFYDDLKLNKKFSNSDTILDFWEIWQHIMQKITLNWTIKDDIKLTNKDFTSRPIKPIEVIHNS